MSNVGRYTIPSAIFGTTIEPIVFTVNVNAAPLDLSNVTITAKARYQKNVSRVHEFTTSITDAVNGVFEIDEQLIDWEVGVWLYSIQFDFPDQTRKVYIEGQFNVLANYLYS
jgi:hypothetical protein